MEEVKTPSIYQNVDTRLLNYLRVLELVDGRTLQTTYGYSENTFYCTDYVKTLIEFMIAMSGDAWLKTLRTGMIGCNPPSELFFFENTNCRMFSYKHPVWPHPITGTRRPKIAEAACISICWRSVIQVDKNVFGSMMSVLIDGTDSAMCQMFRYGNTLMHSAVLYKYRDIGAHLFDTLIDQEYSTAHAIAAHEWEEKQRKERDEWIRKRANEIEEEKTILQPQRLNSESSINDPQPGES
jgi:hypothetical protein